MFLLGEMHDIFVGLMGRRSADPGNVKHFLFNSVMLVKEITLPLDDCYLDIILHIHEIFLWVYSLNLIRNV